MREFTLAEIEHFVDPEDKSHPKFVDVADLEFLMFPRELQLSGESAKLVKLGEAVSKVHRRCLADQFAVVEFDMFLFFCIKRCYFSELSYSKLLSCFYRELLIMRHLVTSLGGSIFS